MPTQAHHPIRRILVLRPGAIGDTLLTFPALLALRRRFPGAEITVVGNRAPLDLGRAAGIVDQADAFGAAWVSDLFADAPTPALRTRLEPFDLGVVWMHTAEAAADLALRLEAAGVLRALALVSFPLPGSGCHVADHLLKTLAPLGICGPRPPVTLGANPESRSHDPQGLAPHLPLSSGDGEEAGGEAQPLVVLHPGAGGRHKRWPAERFAALADRFAELGCSIAVTAGPADEEAVAALRSAVRLARLEILEGLALDALARILARAHRFVGNDSGVTHLAALLNVPTVALFGPFDPRYWAPIGPRVVVVDAGQSCPHRDDPREGCRRCNGLASLEVEAVWQAARSTIVGVTPAPAAQGRQTSSSASEAGSPD